MKSFLFFIIFIVLVTPSLAADCNGRLTQDSDFQDVNKVFECLNMRINSLESKIAKMQEHGAVAGKGEVILYSNDVIDISGVSLGYSGDKVHLSFIVRNKTKNDILLSLLYGSAILVDTSSMPFGLDRKNGIDSVYDRDVGKHNYDVLNPDVPTPISLTFNVGDDFESKTCSFKVVLVQLVKKKQIKYSFGATNAPIKS